jgi:hypothetical protein
MGEKTKPVKVISVGGVGAGAGPLVSLGVAACLVLFIVNAFEAYTIISGILGIVSVVTTVGLGSGGLSSFGPILTSVGGLFSNLSFYLYLDVAAFVFLGIALILVKIKLPQSGASPVTAAIGAFLFAGVAYYLRFIQLSTLMSAFDQIAVSGASITSLLLLVQSVLQSTTIIEIFLIESIMFLIFGLFMRKTVNNLNKSYGKMTRGGRLVLAVAIVNLIAVIGLYIGMSILLPMIQSMVSGLTGGTGGSGLSSLSINTFIVPIIALAVGVILKLIVVPLLALFAFLSLTFGFYGIARGPK